MSAFLSKIQKELAQSGFGPRTTRSRDWFFRKANSLNTVAPAKILNDKLVTSRSRPLIGRMFMYLYDPKYKKTLPYYDKFPLILMVGPAKGGFYGLNLHYLPPRGRAVFFDRLMEYMNNTKLDQTTRFKLSYDLLNSSSRLKAFSFCFKHYLNKHISSKVVEISPSEWEIALFLPTDKFIGEKNTNIWSKSRKSI